MNVLSLCDGISCGQAALREAGIVVDTYYASEIDLGCKVVAITNFPETIDLGDIENWANWDIDWSSIDLILAGPPCQGLSLVGTGLAFDDPRSKLFFTAVNILHHAQYQNPKLRFMFENVVMREEYRTIVSEYLGVKPVRINSALVSAQNRVRDYWANWPLQQPEDKNISLVDIMERPAWMPEGYEYKAI